MVIIRHYIEVMETRAPKGGSEMTKQATQEKINEARRIKLEALTGVKILAVGSITVADLRKQFAN